MRRCGGWAKSGRLCGIKSIASASHGRDASKAGTLFLPIRCILGRSDLFICPCRHHSTLFELNLSRQPQTLFGLC
jgi:hypothetical protein